MQEVSVAFACDDNYAQHMAVSAASLIQNARRSYPLLIYVLCNRLSQDNRDKIQSLEMLRTNTKISFVDINIQYFVDFPVSSVHSIETYFRLKLPSIFPDLDRIIYLDSDIVICDDIDFFWHQKIEDNMLMAVEEPWSLNKDRLASLGMKERSPYFNGGVLYLNLKKMREQNIESKCDQYIKDKKNILRYLDQDVLNAVSEGDWSPLPLSYNSYYFIFEPKYKNQYHLYTDCETKKAIDRPFIVHYNQHPKPWALNCIDPRRSLYLKYLSMTQYKYFKCPQNTSLYYWYLWRFQILKKWIALEYNFLFQLMRTCYQFIYSPTRRCND